MLTKWDEYLIHQTPDPFGNVSGSQDEWFDHFCIFLQPQGPGPHLGTGIYLYPNTKVMAGWVIAVADNVQYNCRVSRQVNNDGGDTTVGPLSFEVVEPLKRWKMKLAKDEHFPVTFGLDFEARLPFFESNQVEVPVGPGSPFAQKWSFGIQLGKYSGSFEIAGKRYDANGYIGMRDRGWGLRAENLGIGFLTAIWAHFKNFGLCLLYIENRDNTVFQCDGELIYEDGRKRRVVGVKQDVNFDTKVGEFTTAEYELALADGTRITLKAERMWPGLVYRGTNGHEARWVNKGPLTFESERWDFADPDTRSYIKKFVKETPTRFICDGEAGIGILEHGASRKHLRYGSIFD